MINDFKTVRAMVRAFTKRFFRDKVALFFTFVFPLIFLLIFGTIFGGDSSPNFTIAVFSQSDTEFSKSFVADLEESEIFTIEPTSFEGDAEEKISQGEIDAIFKLPETFGSVEVDEDYPSGELEIIYDQNDEQLSITLQAVVNGIFDEINNELVPSPTPFTLSARSIQTDNLSMLDYTVAGLVGFSILSLGILSMSEGFAGDKKAGSLRRMKVAPIKTWQLIMATAITRVLVGVMAVAIQIIAALIFFDFNIQGDLISLTMFSILSTICLFGFGMAIAGWAKDSNQAAPLSNLVSFPMMFLSGVFFPVFLMPEWLQNFTVFIPLTPVVEGLRLIMTEGNSIFEMGPQLSVIGVWTVIIYFIAFRVFRWE